MDKLTTGANAFFNDKQVASREELTMINCRLLLPNPFQPRKQFDDIALRELAQSIETYGILQPIIVRKKGKRYEILAGERRFRAAQQAGLTEVPVIIKEFSEAEMMELALLENLQRENLTPIEEAQAYELLMRHLHLTQEQIAERVGKSRPHIANHLRLLKLPLQVRQQIDDGLLTMGHGRALASIKSAVKIEEFAKIAVERQLSVRQMEQIVQKYHQGVKPVVSDVYLKDLENQLREQLGTKIVLQRKKEKGSLTIDFYSDDELHELVALLMRKE
ncbi:stage 0 sporulation protein J [Lysinibacillus alkalisoli]|uniref:Stage 0 sporulation protein J n=1 Tax=Lysinibacillus alkalisoli TaxID=1911548 RepID=A0A917G895_9BACI|nr:ParB/RepB/Spo0J family partition protein [Lysinibacillus alkalisoli]GGG28349.1 stage 0 sporulation protein J [Lysinibacillus alkalisoli]